MKKPTKKQTLWASVGTLITTGLTTAIGLVAKQSNETKLEFQHVIDLYNSVHEQELEFTIKIHDLEVSINQAIAGVEKRINLNIEEQAHQIAMGYKELRDHMTQMTDDQRDRVYALGNKIAILETSIGIIQMALPR